MASNPLPMLAAAAGAFFLMKAMRKDDAKKDTAWEEYTPPSKEDDSPTPDPVTTDTYSFDTLRGRPIELINIKNDGESVTITDIPFDDWEFKVDTPTGYGHLTDTPDRFMGIKVDKAAKKMVVVSKNVAEALQLPNQLRVRLVAVNPQPMSLDETLVYFLYNPFG